MKIFTPWKSAAFFAAAAGSAAFILAANPSGRAQNEAAQDRAAQDDTPRNYQLQYSMGYFSSYKLLDPFLDLTKAGDNYWIVEQTGEEAIGYGEALSRGYLDPETGLPQDLPAGARAGPSAGVLHGMTYFPDYYAGAYTMEWDGKAHGFLQGQPRDMQRRLGPNKLSFYAHPQNRRGLGLRFSQVRGEGIDSIRVYRDEHRKLIEAGEIWNPAFIEHMRRYDVIRTMDFQRINTSPVTKFSQVARPEDPFYVNALEHEWPAPPRYGMPYEILFDLARKADAALWLHIPALIGAPLHPGHPSLRKEDGEFSWDNMRSMARENARAIVDSPEWEIFAAALTDRLVASGYDAGKPLYIEIGNEIWNWAPPFGSNTTYYHGLGYGLRDDRTWGHRHAYGFVLARFADTMETELKKRGLSYNIVYVLASHTANAPATSAAIAGFNAALENMGENASAVAAKTGVALTTYTSCSTGFGAKRFGKRDGAALARAWEGAIAEDPEGLKRGLHDYCINATRNNDLNLHHVLESWKRHRDIIEPHGLRLIGAYEGGSHDWPRDLLKASETFSAWWREFHWGPYGADVVRQTNLALIEEFPGVMLSDFDSIGPIGGAPWVEGHYAQETDLMRVWDEFARPQ